MCKFDRYATCMVVYNRYPSDPRVRRAAEGLARHGYKVHVVCTSESGNADAEVFNGVTIHRVRVKKGSGARWSNILAMFSFMWRSFFCVNEIHRNIRPAFYHVHSLPDFLVFVCIIPKLSGAKIILDLHESLPEIVLARLRTASRIAYFIAGLLERVSCIFADKIIVVNDTIFDLVVKRGERLSRVTVIMNSPIVSSVGNSSCDIHPKILEIRRTGDPLFVYAGGINAERDLVALVQTVKLLKSRGVCLRVLFFTHTETKYIELVKSQIHSLMLEDQMEFCGVLPAELVLGNVARADIGVVSYERSPLTEVALPNKVFEYMAAGVPIVSANLQTLKKFLGLSAVYYEPGDVESLSSSIEKVLHDRNSRERIEMAHQIFVRCSWEIMERRLVGIYQSFSNFGLMSTKN